MKTQIIGAAIGLGAQNPASEMGPEVFRKNFTRALLHRKNLVWKEVIKTTKKDTQLESIIDFMTRLEKSTKEVILHHDFPLVVGGDHSCAIGTWGGIVNGLKAKSKDAEMGLIWVDAHLDSHTFDTSLSQAIHGMPLAVLLGHGGESLLNISGSNSRIKPENTVVIGARSWEKGERDLLQHLGVVIIEMPEIEKNGLESSLLKAKTIATKNTTHFGVTIDLDAFDPSLVPGVCSKEVNGLEPKEFLDLIEKTSLFKDEKLCGLEIVEFAPSEDQNNYTLDTLISLVNKLVD